jgi:hypothetical protein
MADAFSIATTTTAFAVTGGNDMRGAILANDGGYTLSFSSHTAVVHSCTAAAAAATAAMVVHAEACSSASDTCYGSAL